MHVISKKPFNHAAKKYPNDRLALMEMYRVLNSIEFKTPEELRAVFPSLDNFKYKDRWWVLDVGGNNLRMMAFIQFVSGRIYGSAGIRGRNSRQSQSTYLPRSR